MRERSPSHVTLLIWTVLAVLDAAVHGHVDHDDEELDVAGDDVDGPELTLDAQYALFSCLEGSRCHQIVP